MNKGSLEIVDVINLYLSKEYELSIEYDNGVISEWGSKKEPFKLFRDKHGVYTMVHKKRMVNFNPEVFISTDLRHEIIISMLHDIGIDVRHLLGVGIKVLECGSIVYIVNERVSYGGVIACDYTANKMMIGNKYCYGMTYKNRLSELCIKV